MPVIKLEISKQSEEIKRELISELTKTASKITGIREEAFVTFINEHDNENIGVGGKTLADKLKK